MLEAWAGVEPYLVASIFNSFSVKSPSEAGSIGGGNCGGVGTCTGGALERVEIVAGWKCQQRASSDL